MVEQDPLQSARKKNRAWFSHGSGAILALKTFEIITEEVFHL